MSVGKLDQSRFDLYVKKTKADFKNLRNQVDEMISDVETCSNYVEKYVPMHL